MGNKNIGMPPTTNRGAQNTGEGGLIACVDWLQVTFKNLTDVRQICELLYLDFSKFEFQENGKFGYKHHYRYGHMAFYVDGAENMGVHMELTGQGCREFENESKLEWSHLFALVLDHLECNITRLDLAIDDIEGYFTVDQVISKVRRGHVRSKFKTAMTVEKYDLSNGEGQGKTLYIGEPTSRLRVRIYDKKKERENTDKEVIVDHWVRTEIQARNQRAHIIAEVLAYSDFKTGQVITGILKNYINFLAENKKDKNKSRWKICKWWDKFLGDVDKIKLTKKAPDFTIERTNNWINKQVAPALAMLLKAVDYDIDFLYDLIKYGDKRMKDKHYNAIKLYKNQLNDDDLKDINTLKNIVNRLTHKKISSDESKEME